MDARPRRAWWLWPIGALVLIVLVGAATQHRRAFATYYQWRIDGWPERWDEWMRALRGVLRNGDDAAYRRLARRLTANFTNPEQSAFGDFARDPGAEVLIPHFLAAAAAVDDAQQRRNALVLLGLIVAPRHNPAARIECEGELVFAKEARVSHWRSGDLPPPGAVRIWADWLVEHGFIQPNDPVLNQLGPRPVSATANKSAG
jgi:hypothetical protein